nr:hypothetical protein [Tanacetum cinerariifolium]
MLIENHGNEGDDHFVTYLTTFSSYSIKHDFLNNLPKVYINDIHDIGKDMSCVVVATVKKIEHESDWWLVFMCTNKACGQDTDVEYKQAHSILDKSAAGLLQVVRKNRDMDILPIDFNKLLENKYDFKVDIKDFNIEKNKHTHAISQLTKDIDIIQELIKKEYDDQYIYSPGKPKLLNVIDVDDDPLFSSTKKKLLSPKKEKEDK